MGYLEKFARNRRLKGKTEVLTARLPESLCREFRNYCDDMGLSISEAIGLLIEHEMKVSDKESEKKISVPQPKVNTNVYKNSDDDNDLNTGVYKINDDDSDLNTNVYKSTTPVVKAHTNVVKINTTEAQKFKSSVGHALARFTTKQWQVNDDLPCPICGEWTSASNFSRHAKQHNTNTRAIFMDKNYLVKVNEMIKDRTDSLNS